MSLQLGARSLGLCAALAAWSCGGPTTPSGPSLSGNWTGRFSESRWFSDTIHLSLLQAGSTVSAAGRLGSACPGDGTCWLAVDGSGQLEGEALTLVLNVYDDRPEPPAEARFEGTLAGPDRIDGRLLHTRGPDRPVTLRRVPAL